MARRRAALLFALAALFGVLLRRRSERRRERVDLYFGDGSMVSFRDDSLSAQRLLPIGRDLLHAARDPVL